MDLQSSTDLIPFEVEGWGVNSPRCRDDDLAVLQSHLCPGSLVGDWVIAPISLLAFMIWMWAGACWWKSIVMSVHAISWSILLGSGTF